jgi:predicted secreted protein
VPSTCLRPRKAIFTAALDVALLSYVQDSLANDEITDNPPTSINLAVACFYTSMLLAVLAVAFYGLMAFKCYHDIHKTAKIARPVALTEDVPIAIYKKLQERYIPRGYRFLVKLTMSLRDKLAKLSERTELRGETDQPRTTLPALPDSSDGFPGRSSTPEDPKIEQQKIEADTWESTMVTVGTYKFTMVSQTWPSLFTLIVGLLLLAWAKHSGLVATITVTITGIFFADLLGTIANDASYLHPGELYGRTSLVFRLTLTLPFMCLAFCAGSIVLVLFLLGVITICVVGLLVFLLVSLIFGIVDICHSAYNLCTPCIRKKASSGSPEDGIPLDGNTLVLAGELSS